jgi:hypothetical protein
MFKMLDISFIRTIISPYFEAHGSWQMLQRGHFVKHCSSWKLKQLVTVMSITLLILLTCLTGCTEVEDIAVTPDGRVLLVTESANDRTGVMECTEVKSNPPELNCRSYKINMNTAQ